MLEKLYYKINSDRIYFILFIVFLTFLSSGNLFHSGIIFNHDVNFHLHRIAALVDNIRIGKLTPVYFNYLNGFGYGNGLFYPDLFLYIPAFFNYIGFSIELSYKLFILIINFVSIFSMYLCVWRITGSKKCSFVSIILYSCSVYRLIDLVDRGSLGECLSFAFLPLVVLGIYEVLYGNYRKSFYLTVGLSSICLSHVISFYLTCIFCVFIVLINYRCLKEYKRVLYLVFNILLSIIITCFFWAPLLEQMLSGDFNFGTNTQIFENILPFFTLFIDFPVTYFLDEWYPSGIGLIYYFGIFYYINNFMKDKFYDRFLFGLFILGFVSIIFTCCSLFWRFDVFYNLFSIIQFPWRFYIFSTVFLSIGFSIMVKDVRFNSLFKIFLIYTVVVFVSNVILYSFNAYVDDAQSNEIMMGEYLPKDFDSDILNDFFNNDIEYDRIDNVLYVSVLNDIDSVELPLIYYKGYSACSSEMCYDVFKTDKGLVGVNIGSVHDFIVYYDGTSIRKFSMYISAVGFVLFLVVIYRCRYE